VPPKNDYFKTSTKNTPDKSKAFHYSSCRITKHPLGIISACEEFGLICAIYQHMHSMDKPVISRHGSKGGRFIDGMYTTNRDLIYVTGITIIQDTGILSDHDMVVSKIELGIEKFNISNKKEERFDFRQIMNIPVILKKGNDHPTINENVFHGTDFYHHKNLYWQIQKTADDSLLGFCDRISTVVETLEHLEQTIIERTKSTSTPEEQKIGKLVQPLPEDAMCINNASFQIFEIIRDILRKVHLASMVSILPAASLAKKKKAITVEEIMPGIASVPITKQVDDTFKRSRNIYQRLRILIRAILRHQNIQKHTPYWNASKKKICTYLQCFLNQQQPFQQSIRETIIICQETAEDRQNHIYAIENSCNIFF
jgi:hypothetical protein